MALNFIKYRPRNSFFCTLSLIIALTMGGCAAKTTQDSPEIAKNVILFVGDGMGVSTVTAARIFDGQSKGLKGEAHSLAFETFERLALIKTYNTNSQVPDSAGTATALLSGYKTNIGTINVKPDARYQGCSDIEAPPKLSDHARAAGKAVGLISTTRITHATPAALYGHADRRSWEADADLPSAAQAAGCHSLAAQFVDSPLDIALGGGRRAFTDAQIETLKNRHIYVTTKDALAAAPATGSLRGLFTPSHMSFETDRDPAQEPSLAEMTEIAIERLSQTKDGYVLLVEAGRIDHAHHGTNAYRALTDMQALNEAVKIAKAKTGDDTLILVTADHSHTFTIAGYPARGNPILGLVRRIDRETGAPEVNYAHAADGKPYTTLGYYNGEHPREADSPPLSDNIVQSKNFQQEVAIKMESETHSGEDVPLYATGPGSERVGGVMEQDEIFTVMIKALGLD